MGTNCLCIRTQKNSLKLGKNECCVYTIFIRLCDCYEDTKGNNLFKVTYNH